MSRHWLIMIVAFVLMGTNLSWAATPDVAVLIVQPKNSLQVYHHARPCHAASNLAGGGLIAALIDRGVETGRYSRDRRIGQSVLAAAKIGDPMAKLNTAIQESILEPENRFIAVDDIRKRESLMRASKRYYMTPDRVAESRRTRKYWYRAAPRFLDYTPLQERGIRYVVRIAPQIILESEHHKAKSGFMGIRAQAYIIDLEKKQVIDDTKLSVGFSAAGGLQAIPIFKTMWKAPTRDGSSANPTQPTQAGSDAFGPAVATNLEILEKKFLDRLDEYVLNALSASQDDGVKVTLARR